MEQTSNHITDEERTEFTRLIAPLEQELAKRAVDSWQLESRPNPLAEFEQDGTVDANGRRHVPSGHITFQGDFDSQK